MTMQIFVTGMHRSGTSMVCRLINLMGAYFGPEGCQILPNVENPKGFWERQDIRKLNDDILDAAGCTWDKVDGYDASQIDDAKKSAFEARAREIIFHMDGFRPWVVKEPRLCFTLPFYSHHCEQAIVVLVVRHPSEVAASLKTRDGFDPGRSLKLWRRYNESAVGTAGAHELVTVRHEEIIESPERSSRALFYALYRLGVRGIHLPAASTIRHFVDARLHRNKKTDAMDDPKFSEAYSKLLSVLR